MAIEKIVTDAAVSEIADRLTANGEKVTNRAIWSALGGGGMTTISQCLRNWKAKQVLAVSAPIERAPLPTALVDVLNAATVELWNAALAETKSELEQLTLAGNARIAEAHTERDDTLVELESLAEELEKVKAERDTALNKNNELQAENAALRLDNSAASKKDETINELSKTNSENCREILKFFEEKQALQHKNDELERNYDVQGKEIERLLKIVESVQNNDKLPLPKTPRVKNKKPEQNLPLTLPLTKEIFYVKDSNDIIKQIMPNEKAAILEAQFMTEKGVPCKMAKSINQYSIDDQFRG